MFRMNYINNFHHSYVAVAGAVIGIGTGVYKTVKSNNAEKKARRQLEEEKRNRVDYIIPDEFQENVDLTAQQAATGIGSAAEDFYTTLMDRNLASSTDAILSMGASPNSLQELIDNYNQSAQQLAVTDANARRAGVKDYMDANLAFAGQKLIRDFGVPNERQRNDIASLNNSIWQSQQGVNDGISDITGSLAAFVASGAAENLGKKKEDTNGNDNIINTPIVTGNMQTVMTEDQMYPRQNQVPYYLQPRNYKTRQQQIDEQLNNRWGQYQF